MQKSLNFKLFFNSSIIVIINKGTEMNAIYKATSTLLLVINKEFSVLDSATAELC